MKTFLMLYGSYIALIVTIVIAVIIFIIQRKSTRHNILSLRSRVHEKEMLVQHFREAEKKAREENTLLAREHLQFLTRLNRTIRTPLNTINGLTTLICSTDLDEEQSAFVQGISHSVGELVSSVDDMMKTAGLNSNSSDNAFHANNSSTSDAENSSQLDTGFGRKYPMKVLIAEDDLMNQQLAMMILTRLGYDPDIAKNGNEVLEMVSEKKYDVILMDVEMPEMNGLEATRMIRLCLETQPYIIAMTAGALDTDRENCLNAGMNGYVSKPINIEELTGLMKNGYRKAA